MKLTTFKLATMPIAVRLTLLPVTLVWSVCHPDTGPPGEYDCYAGRHYGNQFQWATCVTNDYMRQKSKGRHQCRDKSRTYCYYQCMLEVHGIDSGNVTSDCSCDPNSRMTTQPTSPDVTTLSPRCFSPNGTDCAWYRDCLEAKFQCSSGPDDYGILYGEAFCRLYENRRATVSPLAQNWIDNVRKCLQVELVPLLRPFESFTCRDVKSRAFNSHAGCYVTPFRSAPSVCQLPVQDFWRVFWTVRTAFRADFVESVLRLMEVRQDCQRLGVRDLDAEMRKLMIALKLPLPARRKRFVSLAAGERKSDSDFRKFANQLFKQKGNRSRRQHYGRESEIRKKPDHEQGTILTDNDNQLKGSPRRQKRETVLSEEKRHQKENSTTTSELFYHQTAGKIVENLAKQLHWENQDVLWFAYGVYLDDGTLQVHILLADKTLSTSSANATVANLTKVVELTTKAFEKGEVDLSVDGEAVPQPGVLSSCEDLNCGDVSFNVTAPPRTRPATYENVTAPLSRPANYANCLGMTPCFGLMGLVISAWMAKLILSLVF